MAARTNLSGVINIQSGSRTFGPVTIADDVRGFQIELARSTTATPTIWPNQTTTVDLAVEISLDGGATWLAMGGFGGHGGIYVRRDLTEQTHTYYSTNFPAGAARQVRVHTVVAGGPLRTRVSLVTDAGDFRAIVRP